MAKGRYILKNGEMFDWDVFQAHMEYSNEEMIAVKKDPLKSNYIQKGAEAEFNDRWIVVEVVESHGCESGLQVGDRLYFSSMGSLLDLKRSSPWCPHAMANLSWYIRGFRALYSQGINPEKMYNLYGGCEDSGPAFNGLGRVVFKFSLVDSEDIDGI